MRYDLWMCFPKYVLINSLIGRFNPTKISWVLKVSSEVARSNGSSNLLFLHSLMHSKFHRLTSPVEHVTDDRKYELSRNDNVFEREQRIFRLLERSKFRYYVRNKFPPDFSAIQTCKDRLSLNIDRVRSNNA